MMCEAKELLVYSSLEMNQILDKHLLLTITDLDGFIQYASEGICLLSGYSKDELIGKNQKIFGHNPAQNSEIEKLWENITNSIPWHGELENFTKDGSSIWLHVTIEPLYDKFGNKYGYMALKHNITDKKQHEVLARTDALTKLYNRGYFDLVMQKELEKNTFLNSTLGLLIIDIDHFKEFNDHYGHPKGDSALKKVAKALHAVANEYQGFAFRLGGEEFGILVSHVSAKIVEYLLSSVHKRIQNLKVTHEKSQVSANLTVSIGAVLADLTGRNSISDYSQQLYARADLLLYRSKSKGRNASCFEYIEKSSTLDKSRLDDITELPTRDHLCDLIEKTNSEKMLILIQVTHHEYIQSQYGQKGFNTVLLEKSKTYNEIIQDNENASLFRLNINEFAILVEDESLFESYLLKAKHYILDETLSTVDFESTEQIVASQVIAVAISNENLLRKADLALKKANRLNVNFYIYETSMSEKQPMEDIYFKEISRYKNALENNRIIPFFQPIVHAGSGEVFKYEALARVLTEDNTILLPHEFLKMAKEDRTYHHFTKQLLQKIFNVYHKNSHIGISINLSYESISSEDICFYIRNRLDRYGGKNITFEIIESEEIEDYQYLFDFIKLVKSYGASIAIDDFGTGYSNLAHLMKLTPDFLKIDGSLITTLHTDKKVESIVRSLLLYTKKTNSQLIAEYVSNKEIAEKATQVGIQYLQGFYYGRPQPPEFYGLEGF